MPFTNTEAAEFWSAMAPTWVSMDQRLDEVAGPPGLLAMDRLDVRPGHRVVDLGCGTGATTVELARRAAPGGDVLGVDIAEGMLTRSRQRAAQAGVENVAFEHADVQVHAFGERRFDRAYSRFGVMFFNDLVAAFANVRRALREGSRLSFVSWQGIFANEWMLIPGVAATTALGVTPAPPGPDDPGPFRLSDPERVGAVLDAAGFRDVDVLPHNDSFSADASRIPELAATSSRIGMVGELLRERDEDARRLVEAAIEDAFRARVEAGNLQVARGVLLVTAQA